MFGTTSGHLRSGNFLDFPCKRHQSKHLVFSHPSFASRVAPVRSRSRPPVFLRRPVLSRMSPLTLFCSRLACRSQIMLVKRLSNQSLDYRLATDV
jgi:hypothetical protein